MQKFDMKKQHPFHKTTRDYYGFMHKYVSLYTDYCNTSIIYKSLH